MRRIIGIMMTIIMTLGCISISGQSAVYAAEIIPVYLNGEQIVYDSNDAQPQIFSSRTYVPIRKTAESLGLTIDWNSKTETLTFTRDGVTIAHTMRSDIVYVNGEPVRFDTKSINKNNRTLMPVRMLAESIGADVQWDDVNRCVNITTTIPEVMSVSSSSTVVSSGSEITLTAVASSATKLKFVDSDTKETLAEVTESTEGTDGNRTFKCNITPQNSTNDSIIKTYYVYPGNDSGYIESLDKCGKVSVMISSGATTTESTTETTTDDDDDNDSLGVQGSYKSDHLIKIKLNDTNFDLDDYAELTIRTDDSVNRVKVTNSFGDRNAIASDYDESDDGEREFEVKTKLTKKGTVKLYVTLSTEDGGYEDIEQTIVVKVTDPDDDSDTDYGDLEIIDIVPADEDVYEGEDVKVYVYTSTDIVEVSVYDDDDNRLDSSAFTTQKYSNKYKWTLTFEMESDDTEKFRVIAYDKDDNETEDTFKIDGQSYSESSLVLLSVNQKTKNVEEDGDCKLEIRTTRSAEKVVVKTKGGSELGTATDGSSSGGQKEFSLTIQVGDADDEYVAYAYDEDDNSDSKKFTLDVYEVEDPEILDIDVSDSTVDEGDEVEVTVYTNKAVERVWIEDSAGDRVGKRVSSPDDEDDNEYIWELSFNADDTGSRVSYNVIAEGEDSDNYDEYDFTLRVVED